MYNKINVLRVIRGLHRHYINIFIWMFCRYFSLSSLDVKIKDLNGDLFSAFHLHFCAFVRSFRESVKIMTVFFPPQLITFITAVYLRAPAKAKTHFSVIKTISQENCPIPFLIFKGKKSTLLP